MLRRLSLGNHMNPKFGTTYLILLESLSGYMNHEPFQGSFGSQGRV